MYRSTYRYRISTKILDKTSSRKLLSVATDFHKLFAGILDRSKPIISRHLLAKCKSCSLASIISEYYIRKSLNFTYLGISF